MKTPKEYVVEYDYCFRQSGRYHEEHKHHTIIAENAKEARKLFDAWHEEHGEIRTYPNGRRMKPHPFHIEIHRI